MEDSTVKRRFVLGDEWIYFKFYTGAKTADKVLVEAIKPFTEHLLSRGKIDQWFFIRYTDPDIHLRVRLHYNKKNDIGIIIKTVFKYINKYVEQELIWTVQTDTYQRELERYGTHTMLLSERLFFHESNLLLRILSQLKISEGETNRWIFALKLIDNLLDCFQFSSIDKLHLLQGLRDSYAKEFEMGHFLKSQLDVKFRKERTLIEKELNNTSQTDSIIPNLLSFLTEYNEMIKPIAHEILDINRKLILEVTLESLMSSYIHMSMNRLFKSKQRMHEMVLYDFLFRYYKSKSARLAQKSNT